MKIQRMNKLNKSVIILDSSFKSEYKSKSKNKSKYKHKKKIKSNWKIQSSPSTRKFEVTALLGRKKHVRKSLEMVKDSKMKAKATKKTRRNQKKVDVIPSSSSSSSLSDTVITLSDSEDDTVHKEKKKSDSCRQNSESICVYPSHTQILQSLQNLRKRQIKVTSNAIRKQKRRMKNIKSADNKRTKTSSDPDETLDDIIEVWSSVKGHEINTCSSSEITKENDIQNEKEVTSSNMPNEVQQNQYEVQRSSASNQTQQHKLDQQQENQNQQDRQYQKIVKRIYKQNNNNIDIIDPCNSFEDFTANVYLSNFEDNYQIPSVYSIGNRQHYFTSQEMPPSRQWPRGSLREIVIDGCNVAMAYTQGKVFSEIGLKLVVDYFLQRGHTVRVFIPQHKRSLNHPLLEKLYLEGIVVFTPSRIIAGKKITSYDDRFILQYATICRGIVISHDQFRDLYQERAEWRDTIENRLLAPTFVGDYVMFPEDPLGRNGPSLDEFLRHQ